MKAGALRYKITIQQAVETRDAFGAAVVAWQTFNTCWADISPISGRELLAAQQVQSEISVRINARYMAGVTPKMRAVHGAKIYNIVAVIDPHEMHRELQLMCSEGLNDG